MISVYDKNDKKVFLSKVKNVRDIVFEVDGEECFTRCTRCKCYILYTGQTLAEIKQLSSLCEPCSERPMTRMVYDAYRGEDVKVLETKTGRIVEV